MPKMEDKHLLGPFFYLWFALSILLNISGIASIVDGFVHWANFFKDFLDTYRAWIREPLVGCPARLAFMVAQDPPWVFDWLIICAAFFFGLNATFVRHGNRSAFSEMFDSVASFFFGLFIFCCWAVWVIERPGIRRAGAEKGRSPGMAPLYCCHLCHGHRACLPELAVPAHWLIKPTLFSLAHVVVSVHFRRHQVQTFLRRLQALSFGPAGHAEGHAASKVHPRTSWSRYDYQSTEFWIFVGWICSKKAPGVEPAPSRIRFLV